MGRAMIWVMAAVAEALTSRLFDLREEEGIRGEGNGDRAKDHAYWKNPLLRAEERAMIVIPATAADSGT